MSSIDSSVARLADRIAANKIKEQEQRARHTLASLTHAITQIESWLASNPTEPTFRLAVAGIPHEARAMLADVLQHHGLDYSSIPIVGPPEAWDIFSES